MKDPRQHLRPPGKSEPRGDEKPPPEPPLSLQKHPDARLLSAWRRWLAALAEDAEAALAASHLYAELSPDARWAWLNALAEDVHRIPVPPIAVYAPLLAVESDPDRKHRISQALGEFSEHSAPRLQGRALRGTGSRELPRVAVLVAPLYLRFVRVLRCAYTLDQGFLWAFHDLLILEEHAPKDGDMLEGQRLEQTPMKLVIEDLARAVLAHRRSGAEPPQSLIPFADLFTVRPDTETEGKDDSAPLP